jgi:ABC-2 type transport system ATP-binding protein
MMLGLLTPTSGNVEVLGVPVLEQPEAIRSRVGYMSQRFSLYNDLTVLQNLRFYGTAYGLSNKKLNQQIDRALQMAGLEGRENVRTQELSGGWRQRLALGAAILHEPEVLFLDEPTAGVDPLSRRDFWELLYQLVADGVTVFVTTHYMDEAEHCHRLALLQRGQIIASGSPDEMRNQGMHGQVLEIVSSDSARAVKVLRAAKIEGRLPLESVELYGSLVHVIAEGVESLQDALALELKQSEIESGRMAIIEPSLEDVFIAYMRD